MAVSFNLVDEPWIPVVWVGGAAGEVGLRDALVRAHEIRELVDGSPLVTVSLHRLLLAILHRNFGPSTFEAWKPLWQRGHWDAATLEGYFATWRHRFDLFDPERPFYQLAEMEKPGPKHGPSFLAHERGGSSENTITLFDHSFDDRPDPMPAGAAARYLVARQAYSLAFGKSSPFYLSATPLLSGYAVMALGRSLFQTLALNLTQYGPEHTVRPTEHDAPVWEQEAPAVADWNGTPPRGPLDYLTWQSRRIKLIHDEQTTDVRACYLAQNLKLTEDSLDPQKPYRRSDSKGWTARFLDADKALWRDSHAIFEHDESRGIRRPVGLNWLAQIDQARDDGELDAEPGYEMAVTGLAAEKGRAASILLWRHERFTVPLAYLHDEQLLGKLETALGLAEEVGGLLKPGTGTFTVGENTFKAARPFQVLAKVLLAVGDNEPDRRRVASTIEHLAPERRYWSRLEVPFRTLLADLAGDRPEAAQEAWAVALQDAAWSAFREATSGLDRSARALEAVARAELELRRRLADCLGNHLPQREGATA